ncbi:hypothetical protein PMAYCL1PPCAC_03406, partial [Pristionchus mayeri]
PSTVMQSAALILATIAGVTLSACDSDWTQSGDKCLKLIPTPKTWFELSMACAYQGGRLASIASPAENEAVRRIAAGHEIYIGGLSYKLGPWSWSDDTPFGYSNWAAGSEPTPTPARSCIKMNPSGQWFNNCCRTPPAAGVCSKSA